MRQLAGALLAITIFSGVLFGLGHLSDRDLMTGNFYKMDNASDLEHKYNSINWNKTSEKNEYAGSIYLDSFQKLNSTEISISNKTINSTPSRVLKFSNSKNQSINITFSDNILGIASRNISLNKSSGLSLRFRENISLRIESSNKTYSKDINIHISNKTDSKNQTESKDIRNETTTNQVENKTDPVVLNLSTNTSRNITSSNSLKMVNNRNYSVKLEYNRSNIVNSTETWIKANQNYNLNTTEARKINIEAENKTRYMISYIGSSGSSAYNISAVNTTNSANKSGKNNSSDQKITSKGTNTEKTVSNSSIEFKKINKTNSSENRTLNDSYPEKGGEWVKIKSKRIEDFYIFKYEASKKGANSTSEGDSDIPYSQQGVEPWNEVSQVKASKACNILGENYSLPSNRQWQAATGAIPGNTETFVNGNTRDGHSYSNQEQSCEISENADWNEKYCLTGTGPKEWETTTGIEDMKGNLWEWTSNIVETSSSNFPSGEKGWISSWDREKAKPSKIRDEKSSGIQNSYYYSASEGKFAVRRGGAWHSGERGGLFSVNIDRKKTDSRSSIGFRCVNEN